MSDHRLPGTDLSPEDFISHNIREIILEEDLGRILKEGKTTILTGKPIRTAFRTRDRAGNIVWFEDNSSFLDRSNGKNRRKNRSPPRYHRTERD